MVMVSFWFSQTFFFFLIFVFGFSLSTLEYYRMLVVHVMIRVLAMQRAATVTCFAFCAWCISLSCLRLESERSMARFPSFTLVARDLEQVVWLLDFSDDMKKYGRHVCDMHWAHVKEPVARELTLAKFCRQAHFHRHSNDKHMNRDKKEKIDLVKGRHTLPREITLNFYAEEYSVTVNY